MKKKTKETPASKPLSLGAYTDHVEDVLEELFLSPLSAKHRAMVLTGLASTASAMARVLLDNEIEPIE